jgi:heme exporter protein D
LSFCEFYLEKFGRRGKKSYLCSVNIKQEFGKWFLDVAKYVLTAMILTSMIEGLSQMWLVIGASVLMILCLVFGAVLMRKGKEEEERRERNRQRHKDKVKKGG